MIAAVAVVSDRRPTLSFIREWRDAMAAKKLADPALTTVPLPAWVEIVDGEGRPTARFAQLARLFTPPLAPKERFADPAGLPTPYALSWWSQAA